MNLALERQPQRPQPRGFTLVELLVVIGLIAFMVSVIAVVAYRTGQSQRIKASSVTVGKVQMALMKYYTDFDRCYPPIDTYNTVLGLYNTANLYDYIGKPLTGFPNSPYCAFTTGELRPSGATQTIVDAFGQPVIYGATNTLKAQMGSFYLYSPGADGIAGNADDITAPKQE